MNNNYNTFASKFNKMQKVVIDDKDFVQLTVLYDALGNKKSNYARYVRKNILDNPFAAEGTDYSSFKKNEISGLRGRFREDYILTFEFALKLCMVDTESEVADKIKNELTLLAKKVKNLEYLTVEQSAMAFQIINFLKYMENMKLAEKAHSSAFLESAKQVHPHITPQQAFSKFAQYRNKALNYEKDYIDIKLREYCVANSRKIPKGLSRDNNLIFMGMEFDVFKNAVFDLLKAHGTEEDVSQKFSNVVKKIAQISNTEILKRNETNLFQNKETVEMPKINPHEINKLLK